MKPANKAKLERAVDRAILCDANLDGARISYRDEIVTLRFERAKGDA